jgi:hypothetical protein
METLSADVLDNERKFEQALNEQQRRGKDTSETLNVFIEEARPQIETLREEFKLAQSLFDACAEYYGEVAGRTQPDVLFGKIAAFSKNFTLAMNENEARKRIVQVC